MRTLGSTEDQERANPKTGRLPEHMAYHTFVKSQLFTLNAGVGSEHTQIFKHNWYLTGIPPRIPLSARTVPHTHIKPIRDKSVQTSLGVSGLIKRFELFCLIRASTPPHSPPPFCPPGSKRPETAGGALPRSPAISKHPVELAHSNRSCSLLVLQAGPLRSARPAP